MKWPVWISSGPFLKCQVKIMTMTRNDYLTKSYSTKRSFNWENEIFRLNVLRTMVIVEFFTAMHSFVNINKKRFRLSFLSLSSHASYQLQMFIHQHTRHFRERWIIFPLKVDGLCLTTKQSSCGKNNKIGKLFLRAYLTFSLFEFMASRTRKQISCIP